MLPFTAKLSAPAITFVDCNMCVCMDVGSYYLTATYGALEHIKTFDRQQIGPRELSKEIQDSIQRWERRRTLNLEWLDQKSVQV